jgi:uncharacterized protein
MFKNSVIGVITSVNGANVNVRLHKLPSSLKLLNGENFRIGQIGGLYSIHVGLVHLIAICDGIQAGNLREQEIQPSVDLSDHIMSLTLFGEIFQGKFERGVGQYPTIGDEVHVIPESRLRSIYSSNPAFSFELGYLSAAPTLPVSINLDKFVTRHSAVFGATGSGKSNFVSLVLEKVAEKSFPSARCIVIDPHGEFSHLGTCFGTSAEEGKKPLLLPYWALPLDALFEVCQLHSTPNNEILMRDWVLAKKIEFATKNNWAVAGDRITGDSPIPFSIREFWFDFQNGENATFTTAAKDVQCDPAVDGSAAKLIGHKYPPHGPRADQPFAAVSKNLARQLDSLRSVLLDVRYNFLLGEQFDPCVTESDKLIRLDELVMAWIGSDKISSVDLSVVDAKVDGIIAGSLLAIIYEFIFWGQNTKMSGHNQPLLIVIDEAHRLLPSGAQGLMSNIVKRIAKEGRKFGQGLMIVTQRPSEVDETVLSQLGSIVALRTTNAGDRAKILSIVPDEFGALGSVLPALRNGESFLVGEAVPIPTRMRTELAKGKLKGHDPEVTSSWIKDPESQQQDYATAYEKWLNRTL